MAHFAEIDEDNRVLRVLVIPDFMEHRGEDYLSKDMNLGGKWLQTSYSGKIRKRFAGIGMFYHQALDAFVFPKPYPSWTMNQETADWEAPIPMPENTNENTMFLWNEDNQEWVEIEKPSMPYI